MARKALSKKTRFEVFKRDGFRCMYCGATPNAALLQVDHITAVANGGANDMGNLVTACQPCNAGKSAIPLGNIPQSLANQAAEIKEREEQILGYSSVMAARRARIDQESWQICAIYNEQFNEEKDTFQRDWRLSIKNFIEQLGVDACIQAMEIAVCKKPHSKDGAWRYFCGICWTKVRNA